MNVHFARIDSSINQAMQDTLVQIEEKDLLTVPIAYKDCHKDADSKGQ